MRILSAAQVTREIDQLKQIVAVYYRYNPFDIIDDIEKRIVELENLLHAILSKSSYTRTYPAGE